MKTLSKIALLLLIASPVMADSLEQPVYVNGGEMDVNCVSGCSAGSGTLFAGTTVYVVNPTTVTFNGVPQPVNIIQNSVLGATVTFNGAQPVQITTGGITAAQGGVWDTEPGTGTWPVNVKNSVAVTGSFFQTVQPVQVTTGGVTASQGGVWDTEPGTGTWPVNVKNSVAVTGSFYQTVQPVQVTTGGVSAYITNVPVVTISQPSVLGATITYNGTQTVFIATGGVTAAQGALAWNIVSTNTLTVNVATGGVTVGGAAANGASESGNPVPLGVLVTSNTVMPTAQADAKMQTALGDKFGRMLIVPFVSDSMVQTATATFQFTGQQRVLISSPAAASYAQIIGCVISSTGAAPGYVTVSPGCASAAGSFVEGVPSTSPFTTQFFPPRPIPQPVLQNNDWCVTPNAATMTFYITCWYYTST